ncbi:MAG: reverse transcriptase domain-containing protein [Agathobacter sp.]|nr:reverse transcriptase domain-containing protein [Agathobacter sp.]
MNRITDMNALYEAYKASMKGSAWKEEPQRFEIDFLSEITRLHQELESRTYKTLEGTEFTLNERGKIRYIHGSRMRDRVVRHALCDEVLTPCLHPYLIYNNGASQKGKGITFARRMFEKDLHNYWLEHGTNEGYVGFVDLSKFYDNIQHDKIKEEVYPKIDEFSQWLLGEILSTFEVDVSYMSDEEFSLCMDTKFDSVKYHAEIQKEAKTGEKFMKKSVDIGDQVSQDIGVFFPTRLDNYAKIVRGCKRYGRYMDDIYIIGETKEYVESIIEGIQREAEKMGMFINKKKTRVTKLSGTYKYLQVKYSLTDTGKVIKRINPQSVTRERKKIKTYKRLLDKGIMSYDDVEQDVRSWMGSHAKIMSKQQIKNMKTLYKELFGKELSWKKRK